MSASPNWPLFAAALAVAVAVLLVAARASERLLMDIAEEPTSRQPDGRTSEGQEAPVTSRDVADGAAADGEDPAAVGGEPHRSLEADATAEPPSGRSGVASLTTEELLLNAGLSQALLGAVVVVAVWVARIPSSALGLADPPTTVLATGVGLGLGLAAANEITAGLAARIGIDHDERLRTLLAPDSTRGWIILLGGVLPLVAGVEELIFRGAVIGALSTGFGFSPWGLAVVSSVLFGLGHTAQGRGGVAVTAGLGFVLAAAFILTGSLVVVVVAHYLVNAVEFAVHEGLGREPS